MPRGNKKFYKTGASKSAAKKVSGKMKKKGNWSPKKKKK